MATKKHRIESDSMGEMSVPADAYYGAQTARAIENFPISGIRKHSLLVKAMGMIKQAAANMFLDQVHIDSLTGVGLRYRSGC